MGSKCSGSYADLFIGRFEGTHIYPRINGKHRAYTRFKDDIFLIWTDGLPSLLEFFHQINQIHPTIKFECKYSKTEISFLDTLIRKDQAGNLSTTLYRKPTDRNAYLHYNSYHPQAQIQNIPYGQFLRCKKICSTQEEAEKAMTDLEAKFQQRGYPPERISAQRNRAAEIDRASLLRDKPKNTNRRTPFSTTYNQHLPHIREIINKHWPILQTHQNLAQTFTEKPVLAYRRNKNLRELIGQHHLSRGKKILPRKRTRLPGCRACLTSTKNECCKHILSTKTFSSQVTGEVLSILHSLNCRSKNLIYLAHCTLCAKSQYVGKSEPPANLRVNTHRHDVNSQKGCPFDKHFRLPGHDFNLHAKFILIEQVTNKGLTKAETRRLLEDREDYWMTRLKTLHPNGMNDHLNSSLRQKIHAICT